MYRAGKYGVLLSKHQSTACIPPPPARLHPASHIPYIYIYIPYGIILLNVKAQHAYYPFAPPAPYYIPPHTIYYIRARKVADTPKGPGYATINTPRPDPAPPYPPPSLLYPPTNGRHTPSRAWTLGTSLSILYFGKKTSI